MTTWYHGTASTSGMEIETWIDPSRGSFEGGVWATSSLKIARQWANAAVAVAEEGAVPQVFEIEVSEDGLAEVDEDEGDAPDADAVVCRRGEGGSPTLFLRARFTGWIARAAA